MPFQLTTIATYRSPTTAWVARNYLADHGIHAHVFDDNIATAIWTWGNATGWTKLQVESEFEHAAQQALLLRHDARELLRSACENSELSAHDDQSSPPCMDRKPVASAERPQRKMNEKEDLVRRAKLAAVCAFILVGNAVGLPGQWERSTGGLFLEISGLGLIGYSTWLLWTASKSQETLRPVYQSDLYWGRCINAVFYSLLAISLIYVVTLGF